jgi:hypothetical protein
VRGLNIRSSHYVKALLNSMGKKLMTFTQPYMVIYDDFGSAFLKSNARSKIRMNATAVHCIKH